VDDEQIDLGSCRSVIHIDGWVVLSTA
jgi:hypothetical protein